MARRNRKKQQKQPLIRSGPLCLLMSNIADSEPTRNVAELRFTLYDWFSYNIDNLGVRPVYSYGIDETQNFLGQIQNSLPDEAGIGQTKNRIVSVSLDVLSPSAAIAYQDQRGATPIDLECDLPLVISAVPVPAADPDDTQTSLIGQNSTVIHPDVRRAWVRVAHWNWRTMFTDTQLQPFYTQYNSSVTPAEDGKGIELFRLAVVDSVNGLPLFNQQGGNLAGKLDFRVSVEIEGPIGLVPDPVRFRGSYSTFAGLAQTIYPPDNDPDKATDRTPTQYKLHGMKNLI